MYEFNSRVRYSEIDRTNHLTIPAFINLIQDAATMHSEDLGVGLTYLLDNHIGWMVTNYAIEISEMPKMGEALKVKTYPYSFKGFIGLRAYELFAGDRLFAKVNSVWALMDLERMMPARIEASLKEVYAPFECPEDIPETLKLKETETDEELGEFVVSESYIDTNGHMNNGVYLSIMSKYLPEGFTVRKINVAFKKSLFEGNHVKVGRSVLEGNTVRVVFTVEDELSCVAEFQ